MATSQQSECPSNKFEMEKEEYYEQVKRWPQSGKHIMAHYDDDMVVVYQAYKPSIADYAVEHQRFGGPHFSYDRMSWIKPNFMWMMYRCGWAQKQGQERVLAVWLTKAGFEEILANALIASRSPDGKNTKKDDLVRLQWDPDHDPHGEKLPRRAIQLGMRGKALENYGKNYIVQIQDITPFVEEQFQVLQSSNSKALLSPKERVFVPSSEDTRDRLGLDFESQQTVVGFTS